MRGTTPCDRPVALLRRLGGRQPRDDDAVARLIGRRLGPLGLALTAYDIWRRLPPKHRRRLMQAGRVHGPRLAAALFQQQKRLRKHKR